MTSTLETAITDTGVDARRARLRTDVTLAAKVVPTHYPLETFIAVNPLAGLEGLPFEQAIRRAGDLYGMPGTLGEPAFRDLYRQGRITDADLDRALARRFPNLGAEALAVLRADMLHGEPAPAAVRRNRTVSENGAPEVAGIVDAQTGKWCAAFFGDGAWPMPGRDQGFYPAWRALAPSDRSLPRRVRAALRRLPERADDAVLTALASLGVDDAARITRLQAHLTAMPGWAAHVAWCGGRGTPIDTLDYLAMRLSYEAALMANRLGGVAPAADDAGPVLPSARARAEHLLAALGETAKGETAEGETAKGETAKGETALGEVADEDRVAAVSRVLAALPATSREVLWQNAFEAHYRDDVLTGLQGDAGPVAGVHTQVVTCIDTRSEGLRRHLEAVGGYETLGFAGFFAVAIRFTDLLGGQPSDLCPVLISPNHEIAEVPAGDAAAAARRVAGITGLAGVESAFHAAKESLAAPFTLAEAAGWAAAPLAAAKTLAPALSTSIRRRLRDAVAPQAQTVIDVDSISEDEQVLFAQVALTTMGLTRGFGRLVVMCAHGSTTENNPYQASLDCGACGGQAGAPNARTAVAILNRTSVRDGLRSVGIDIPADTWFVAAQHDTAVDRVTLLDRHLVPATRLGDLDRLDRDLAEAGAALAAERCDVLPGAPTGARPARAARHVNGRSSDWAQVYPEWGLAGNAAFIVAPRSASRRMDLQRRAFLHSYEADADIDGSALETILTAPLVVAQWINTQYYFSTVAPRVFGAGTKTIHNVVGTAGVIAGHNGDLQLGLPWQSVSNGTELVHEPQRLLAVVQAPLERIDMIIGRNPILQQLFGNDWITVAARENPDQPWQRWTRAGWRPWFDTDSNVSVNPVNTEEMVP